jgi:hypothetical protein
MRRALPHPCRTMKKNGRAPGRGKPTGARPTDRLQRGLANSCTTLVVLLPSLDAAAGGLGRLHMAQSAQ